MTANPRKFRITAVAAALTLIVSGAVQAAGAGPSWDDIAKGEQNTSGVLSYGMGLKAWRNSPLTKINAKNVADLQPAWSFSFGDEKQRGQESQALVYDGIVYVTASYSRLFAMDAHTGKKLWEYSYRLPDDIRPCCDVVNRGPAIYGNKVFFGTLDGAVTALDRLTGAVIWKQKFGDQKVGYTMTGAPFIIKDQKTGRVLLIHGSSGDEFGVVGWLYARDPDTGEEVWARPMVEGHMGRLRGKDSTISGDANAKSWPRDKDGKLVEAWNHGGGAPWQTATFDVETNTVVIGTGNPGPWNTWKRTAEGGNPLDWDSLFTSGQIYVDASTGNLKGFYQHTPNDAWDFSGNNSVLLFDYKDPATGKLVKASAHADRNGFFYITDRTKLEAEGDKVSRQDSALIRAVPFVKGITWAKGIDPKTGKPIETGNRPPLPEPGQEKGASVFVSPPFLGGTNWMPMSYSPQTGLFYIPSNEWGMDYWTEHLTYKPGAAYLGQGFRIKRIADDHVGVLRAIDPISGKIVWEHKEELPLWSGTLNTAGGLVFTGTSDGYLKAFDNKTGKELWKFQTGSGIVSCPITWEMDGEQYVGIASGYGGAVPLWGGDMAEMTRKVTQGGSFWVFKLGKARHA